MTIAPSVAEGYDLWAPTYDSEPNILIALDESDQMREKRLDAVRRAGSGSALDVGCGTGRHLPLFESHFSRVVGLDVSQRMLDRARVRINPAKTSLVLSEFLDLEPAQLFDFVHASLSLMHTLDVGAFLRKVSSLLREGGVFFAVDADASPIQVGMMPRAWVNGAKVVIPFEAHPFEDVVAEANRSGLIVTEAGRVPPREEIVARHPKFRRYAGAPCLYYVTGTKGVAR